MDADTFCSALILFRLVDYFEYATHLEDLPKFMDYVMVVIEKSFFRLNEKMKEMIENTPSRPLSQTVQFSLNAEALAEKVCPYIERYMFTKFRQIAKDSGYEVSQETMRYGLCVLTSSAPSRTYLS